MAKLKKPKKVHVNFALNPEVNDRISELAEKKGMTKGGVVTAAVNVMYEALEK